MVIKSDAVSVAVIHISFPPLSLSLSLCNIIGCLDEVNVTGPQEHALPLLHSPLHSYLDGLTSY